MLIVFSFQSIYFAIALRFAERYSNKIIRSLNELIKESANSEPTMSFESYISCIWCIIITMTTVGYGRPQSISVRWLLPTNSIRTYAYCHNCHVGYLYSLYLCGSVHRNNNNHKTRMHSSFLLWRPQHSLLLSSLKRGITYKLRLLKS